MYSNLLYAHQKYSRNNPLFLLANSRRGRSDRTSSLVHLFLSLETSWRRQVLLYVHSKCVRGCSAHIQDMAGDALFYH